MSAPRITPERLAAILSYWLKPSENMLDEETASLAFDLRDERALNARLVAALKSITSDGPIGSKCHAIDFYHDDGEACDICAALAEVQP